MAPRSNKYDFVYRALEKRREKQRFRDLRALNPRYGDGAFVIDPDKEQSYINLSSNDYLGLSGDPRILEQAATYLNRYGAGSTASRLICGTYDIHRSLEKKLARHFDREAALVFNSGFQANSSIIATLANRKSLVLTDKRGHNSLLQGAMLSRARFRRYRHNDLDDLHQRLERAEKEDYERIIVVTESIFSMDGDGPDLERLIQVTNQFGALLFLDEAHAVGVWGDQGRGRAFGKPGVDLQLGTFGKAYGSFGAFILCDEPLRKFLVNFCPGFIYTTALPPAVIGASEKAVELVPTLEKERNRLKTRARYLRNELNERGFDTGTSQSQIIPVVVGADEQALDLQQYLETEGILASAIRPPTVQPGKARLRITLSSRHEKKHLNKFLHLLDAWNQQ